MTNEAVNDVIKRFKNLELHAAHSGRVILDTLIDCGLTSEMDSITALRLEIQRICEKLLPVLPPYAPPLNSINQVMLVLENEELHDENVDVVKKRLAVLRKGQVLLNVHEKMAEYLSSILPDKATIYTHTLSETLMGVLLALHETGRILRVFVTESRPNNDGWITAEKLADAGIDTFLTLDMAFPAAIDQADVMLSGAEIIDPNGSVVGKIGIFPASIYCNICSKPVYIIADVGKISFITAEKINLTAVSLDNMGLDEPINQLNPFGSYFDVTPSKYIRGYITEQGILSDDDIEAYVHELQVSKWLSSKVY